MDVKSAVLKPSEQSYTRFHYLEIQATVRTPHQPQSVRIHTQRDAFLFPFTLTTDQLGKYSSLGRLLRWMEYVLTYSRVRTCAQVNKAD